MEICEVRAFCSDNLSDIPIMSPFVPLCPQELYLLDRDNGAHVKEENLGEKNPEDL